jgi:hypothetical protein
MNALLIAFILTTTASLVGCLVGAFAYPNSRSLYATTWWSGVASGFLAGCIILAVWL